MTSTCKHDFQFCYRGNRGIALRCARCGKPAAFQKRSAVLQWLMALATVPLWYLVIEDAQLLHRLGYVALILLLLLVGFPALLALIFRKSVRLQDKYLLPCSGRKDD